MVLSPEWIRGKGNGPPVGSPIGAAISKLGARRDMPRPDMHDARLLPRASRGNSALIGPARAMRHIRAGYRERTGAWIVPCPIAQQRHSNVRTAGPNTR